MKVESFIYQVGKDIDGYLWVFDAREKRIFVEGGETERSQRGYPCRSFQEAKRMLEEKK